MGKIFQTLIVFIFLLCSINLVSALDTYQAGQQLDLKHAVRVNGGISSGVGCNITVLYPDNEILIDFEPMTDNTDYFNYTLNSSQTEIKGLYMYTVTCSNGTLSETQDFEFLLNAGGVEPSESRTDATTRNIVLFLLLAVLSFVVAYFSKRLPVKLSLFLLMVWFILMAINMAFIGVQDEVLNDNIENFMSFFLVLGFNAHWFILSVIVIIWILTFFVNFKENIKLKKNKKYGVDFE